MNVQQEQQMQIKDKHRQVHALHVKEQLSTQQHTQVVVQVSQADIMQQDVLMEIIVQDKHSAKPDTIAQGE